AALHTPDVDFLSSDVLLTAILPYSLMAEGIPGENPSQGAKPTIPDTWDEVQLASVQVPLAHSGVSAQHVSKEHYTSLPVRPIYKSYDVYRPDLEPKGYSEWLMNQEPEVVWGDARSPALDTEANWIRAGELVFDAPIGWGNGAIMGPYEGTQV